MTNAWPAFDCCHGFASSLVRGEGSASIIVSYSRVPRGGAARRAVAYFPSLHTSQPLQPSGLDVEEAPGSNRVPLACRPQCTHDAHGTAVIPEPVSTISVKVRAGFPRHTSAAK